MNHRLWGVYNADTTPLLDAGLAALAPVTRDRLTGRLEAARQDLMTACINAAFASGVVTQICPDTPDELLRPERIALRINKESA